MIMRRSWEKGLISLAALLIMVVCFALPGLAGETTANPAAEYGVDQDVALTIEYVIPDVEFRLYKVAEFTVDASQYQLSGPYASLKAAIPSGTDTVGSKDWRVTAQTLYSLMQASGSSFTPDASVKTNDQTKNTNDYKYSGTFKAVPAGLYLLAGDTKSVVNAAGAEEIYTPSVMLLSLPYDLKDGAWDYHPTAQIKYESRTVDVKEKVYEVKKLWAGETTQEKRPASVTIKILCNGKEKEEVKLSSENNWSCTWKGKDADEYNVAEANVPDGYEVKVEKSAGKDKFTFTVTNTLKRETPPDNPKQSETPKPTTPTGKVVPSGGTSVPRTGDDTPLIGMLAALAGAGLLIIILGIVLIRRRRR